MGRLRAANGEIGGSAVIIVVGRDVEILGNVAALFAIDADGPDAIAVMDSALGEAVYRGANVILVAADRAIARILHLVDDEAGQAPRRPWAGAIRLFECLDVGQVLLPC